MLSYNLYYFVFIILVVNSSLSQIFDDFMYKKILLLVLFLIGVLDAGYLTVAHYTGAQLYCNNSGIINCQAVTTSRFSEILGVPIAIMGLIWFIVAIVLLLARQKLLEYWEYLGILAAVYSIASMAALGEICEYCSLLDALLIISAIVVIGYGIDGRGKGNA